MDNPVSVSSIKGTIPSPNANACERFTKALIQFPTLIYQWYSWAVTALGHFSVDFKRDANFLMVGDYIYSASSENEITGEGGRLLCNGQEVAKVTYPALYIAIADLYGTPTSPANFKLPDFGGRFPIGVGDGGGALGGPYAIADTGGEHEHTLAPSEGYAHSHLIANDETSTTPLSASDSLVRLLSTAVNVDYSLAGDPEEPTLGKTSTTGVGVAHENRPPFLAVYVYIQA